ncbi:MAG: tetratricopeptide repeat protein [bacterium]
MKIRSARPSLVVLLVSIFLGLTSCVYFNTYYNAKKYYKDAVKENIDNESGQPKTQNYNKSINSAARVIEYYPDSKYVDDALLIMGKSYYAIRSYPKAKRKCEELIANYPNSELLYEARLFLGKTYIGMRRPDQGIAILNDLWLEGGVPMEIRLEGQRALADYYYENENYRQAFLEYHKILDKMKDNSLRADVRFQVGECHFKLKEYDLAEVEYARVMDEKPSRKRQFDARHKRALSLQKLGKLDAALKIVERLLKKDIYYTWYEFANLSKAGILADLGQYTEAIELYDRILELYPKSFTSAEATYRVGIIQWKQFNDYDKAKEYLDKVQSEKRQSEFFEPAAEIANNIQYLQNLNFSLDSLQLDVDTLSSHLVWLSEYQDTVLLDSVAFDSTITLSPDTLEQVSQMPTPSPELPEHLIERYGNPNLPSQGMPPQTQTGAPDQTGVTGEREIRLAPLPPDSIQVYKRLDEDYLALTEYRFRLAEHFWQRFENVDTAKVIFLDLVEDDTSPDVQARSLMSLYYIYKQTSPDSTGPDSLLYSIHDKFPDTGYDNWVRPKIGLQPLPEPVDTLVEAYLAAEELWLSEYRYVDAVAAFQDVIANWPESDYASKSQYVIAWLQERKLENVDAAMASYDSLISWYPQSQYVSIARKKIAPPPPDEPDSLEVLEDSTALEAAVVVLGDAPPGTGPPVMLNEEDDLLNYIHANHLYPLVASEAGIPGEAYLTFVIDVEGRPKDFRIMRENPEGFDFGLQAIEALIGMRFKPGYRDGEWIEAPMNQVVEFSP